MKTLVSMAASAALLTASLSSSVDAGDDSRFTRITEDWQDPVYRQYDFWIGTGTTNWRGKKPENFFHDDIGTLAKAWVYPTLNGKALLEFHMSKDTIDDKGSRVQGFSIRYYDPRKERWVMAQEWPNPNTSGGVADQLQGFYRFGRVQVFSTYTLGTPEVEYTRRYTFSDIRPEGFIWHGVRTADQGKTWSAGTLVEFSQNKAMPKWPRVGEAFPNYDNASQCTDESYRAFDSLAGEWNGTVSSNGKTRDATLTGYLMLGGCAVMSYLEFDQDGKPFTLLEVRSPRTSSSDWWVYQLDSHHGSPHRYQIGNIENDRISLYENNQYVIEDEFKNLTISKIPRDDSNSLNKTVWTDTGPDTLAFEWWTRASADDEWKKSAEFAFKK